MSNVIDFILTTAASELISKVLGGKTLNFTRMAVGDGFSYDTTVAKGYTTIVNEVLSIDITKKETLTPSSVKITSAFKNTDAEKEFYYREVGLYAQDPDTGEEVLYAYGNRNEAAELITPTGSNVVTKQLAFIISVGDSANVTFNVNAGVYALQEDMTTLQAELNANLKQIVTIKLNDFEGNNDTEKFENMIAYVSTNHKTDPINIIIPSGTYEITNDITIEGWENKKMDIIGKVIFTNCNGITLKNVKSSQIYVSQLIGDVSTSDLTSLTKDGLTLINTNAVKLTINTIAGFRNGLILYGLDYQDGKSRGVYGCEINFRTINRCYNGIRVMDDKVGWVNENTIIGGGIWAYNGLVQGLEEVTTPDFRSFHNNKYLNIEFEQITGEAITFYQGRSCVVQYPRFEGSGISSTSLLIHEYPACATNLYTTSFYLIDVNQVILNTAATGGSKLIADLRNNTSRIASEMISEKGEIKYITNTGVGEHSMNNTITLNPQDGVFATHKTRSGVIRNLLTYSDVQYVQDADMLNGFSNFTNKVDSTYAKLHYYITGENELVLGGFIKCDVIPTNDTSIFTLKPGFTTITRGYYIVGADTSDGSALVQIEVEGTQVKFRKFLVGTSSTIGRMCLNGIRIKIDLPLTV